MKRDGIYAAQRLKPGSGHPAGNDAAWPAPLSLAVAFNEVVLIEGAGPAVSQPLLEVAATLRSPLAGQRPPLGPERGPATREELYRLRRRIAYISPRQVLLHLISLR